MGSDTASKHHPVDVVKDEVAARFLRHIWDKLERGYAPRHVILFGSRATGRAQPDSDVDLIVVSPRFEGEGFVERMRNLDREVGLPMPDISADVLCYTPEEFEVMSTGIGMVAEAVKEGIRIR